MGAADAITLAFVPVSEIAGTMSQYVGIVAHYTKNTDFEVTIVFHYCLYMLSNQGIKLLARIYSK